MKDSCYQINIDWNSKCFRTYVPLPTEDPCGFPQYILPEMYIHCRAIGYPNAYDNNKCEHVRANTCIMCIDTSTHCRKPLSRHTCMNAHCCPSALLPNPGSSGFKKQLLAWAALGGPTHLLLETGTQIGTQIRTSTWAHYPPPFPPSHPSSTLLLLPWMDVYCDNV